MPDIIIFTFTRHLHLLGNCWFVSNRRPGNCLFAFAVSSSEMDWIGGTPWNCPQRPVKSSGCGLARVPPRTSPRATMMAIPSSSFTEIWTTSWTAESTCLLRISRQISLWGDPPPACTFERRLGLYHQPTRLWYVISAEEKKYRRAFSFYMK